MNYRLLKHGEVIKKGDEVKERGTTWAPIHDIFVGVTYSEHALYPIRRKVK